MAWLDEYFRKHPFVPIVGCAGLVVFMMTLARADIAERRSALGDDFAQYVGYGIGLGLGWTALIGLRTTNRPDDSARTVLVFVRRAFSSNTRFSWNGPRNSVSASAAVDQAGASP